MHVRARIGGAAAAACPVPVEATGVPGCDTGPGGRLVFVARELTSALRRRRLGTMSDRTRGTR